MGADESKFCRYHQNKGHTTEDCVTLKDKIESLVQAGHLQRFVQRGGTSSRIVGRSSLRPDRPIKDPHKRQQSRSKSPGCSVRGVINTISGGFAGGGSTSDSRKRHLRSLNSVY